MSWQHALLLLVAGIAGGLTGSIAGLASVATYPALLMAGLPPVAANVTNTVALTFNTIGSVWGSLPELEGMGHWLRRVMPMAVLGGAAGAALLLSLPAEGFEQVVPILLALSSLTIAIPQRRGADDEPGRWRSVLISVAIFGICLYGGYFGAAAGVMLLALFLHGGSESLAHANAAKNVVLGAANGVAGIAFIALAPVHWIAVWPLGLGCLIGARLGPIVVRHAPATPLRLAIALGGLALAAKLGYDAYR
ncbi:sulfite exporter TauE/SafE family protein [Mycolicibacterium mucogenicum]|uniref:Probable membrane transporter protein n=1 Tax=Mycolicibacterium mucogenicum DSM 44124 TaxID=1226753 RepID=A0A8H2JDB3_MYCMU|nr:sulfite exporter TauE/SafE family protein [Mycolicibacterium mucogenicum]KAB7756934.1 transporter [Mycolicibacterium mucogenicum DSM 44124]QPG67434.1 sulfite exporter TauE/SafE family protein [Mycolicibacterium mucogenicum DSM 44124]